MVDPAQSPQVGPLAANAAARAGAPPPRQDALSGARFQALLEDLDQRARAFAQSAEAPLAAEALPAAVQAARASLEGVLQLSDSLLEACRQVSAQSGEQRP